MYSLIHLTSAASTPAELIRAARASGFDAVSLRGIPTRIPASAASSMESLSGKSAFALSENRELFKETKKAAEDTGIIIYDVENARIVDGVDIQEYEKDLYTVAELGVHHVLTNIWTSDKSFYTEKFAELCELAAKYDISINLEFVTWSAVPGIQEAAGLLRKVNAPNAGILLDTFHFYRSGNTLLDLKGLPPEWFQYIHLCDAPKIIPTGAELVRTGIEERLIPGEGYANIREIVAKLPTAVRGLEIPNIRRVEAEGLVPYLTRALRTTKAYLK